MTARDRGELLLLAALWGASFLFMRIAVPAFGPIPMVWLRVAGAAAVLLPLLLWAGDGAALRRQWRTIFVVGLTNAALPFALYAYALQTITASLASIFNAATPLFGALIARAWLGDRLSGWRSVGLVIGFAGVFGLAWERAGFQGDAEGWRAPLSVAACLGAALSYGFSASYTRRYAAQAPAMALAAGSQLSAATLWCLPALMHWPVTTPGPLPWLAMALLAVLCTGCAYILYFRLIRHAGTANALTVTYLVPAFAVAWGWLLLGERPTASMAVGCAVILLGTALATGLWPRAAPAPLRRA